MKGFKGRKTVRYDNQHAVISKRDISPEVFLSVGWSNNTEALLALSKSAARKIGKALIEASNLKTRSGRATR